MKPWTGKLSVFLLLLLLCPAGGKSQQETGRKKNFRFAAFPVLGYSPETRLLGGISSQFIAGLDNSSYISTVGLSAFYTRNKQIILNLYPVIWWEGNRNQIRGEVEYSIWPDKFFGIGNDNPWENEEYYESEKFELYLEFTRKIGYSSHHLGPVFHHQYTDITGYDDNPDARLPQGTIPGSDRSLRTGPGLLWLIDTRDHNLLPGEGHYHQIKLIYYPEWLGSTSEHLKTSVDLRQYIGLQHNHLLYLQVYGHFISGSGIPFTHLSQMGGENRMRGYYYGRLRDKHLFLFQGQYMTPFFLFNRIAFAGFAGFGQVAHELKEFSFSAFRPSAGVGLRFLLFKKERVILRLDVAFGKNDHGIYGVMGEAI